MIPPGAMAPHGARCVRFSPWVAGGVCLLLWTAVCLHVLDLWALSRSTPPAATLGLADGIGMAKSNGTALVSCTGVRSLGAAIGVDFVVRWASSDDVLALRLNGTLPTAQTTGVLRCDLSSLSVGYTLDKGVVDTFSYNSTGNYANRPAVEVGAVSFLPSDAADAGPIVYLWPYRTTNDENVWLSQVAIDSTFVFVR